MCDLVLLLMMRRAAGKTTKGAIMVRILLLPKELAAEFTDKIGQNLHCPQLPLPSEDGTEDASTVPFSYDEGGSGYVPIPNDRRRPMGRS